jgi:hypothetical protein
LLYFYAKGSNFEIFQKIIKNILKMFEFSKKKYDKDEGNLNEEKENSDFNLKEKPEEELILFQVFYKQNIRGNTKIDFNNSFYVNDINSSFHFENSVEEAKNIFNKICLDKEFLPPLKDPNEDDIYDKGN